MGMVKKLRTVLFVFVATFHRGTFSLGLIRKRSGFGIVKRVCLCIFCFVCLLVFLAKLEKNARVLREVLIGISDRNVVRWGWGGRRCFFAAHVIVRCVKDNGLKRGFATLRPEGASKPLLLKFTVHRMSFQ